MCDCDCDSSLLPTLQKLVKCYLSFLLPACRRRTIDICAIASTFRRATAATTTTSQWTASCVFASEVAFLFLILFL